MRLHGFSAVLLTWCAGCATATAVLHEPVSLGRGHSYAAPADSVAAAAARAFEAQGLSLVRDTSVGSTRLLVGRTGLNLNSWGELDRAAITPSAAGTEVRLISRPVAQLDFQHRDRAPQLFRELDRQLGGAGVRPFPGDRVRIVLSSRPREPFTGTVLTAPPDVTALAVEVGDRSRAIPAEDLAQLSLSRGSYGHAKEGALVGSMLGAIVGFIVTAPEGTGQWRIAAKVAGSAIGSLAGLLTGSLIGSAIRAEVWSEVPPTALHDRPALHTHTDSSGSARSRQE